MKEQDLLLASGTIDVGKVPAYESKADPLGGVKRSTKPLIKRIAFSVVRIGC